MPRAKALRVTRRIYGPGPTRRSRVLLAVPGRDYPADFVLGVTGGDESLIDREPDDLVILTDAEVRARAAELAGMSSINRVIVEDAVDPAADTPADDSETFTADDEVSPTVNLARLDRPALVELAAERGVEIPDKATKVQIIGALNAADPAGD